MPWGQMAAQEWGDPSSSRKVLAVHGWMDNSNTFLKLFPLLPSNLHIVSVDLSGHGLSSHRPLGCTYTILEHAIDLKRLADQLHWEGFALIGHSMGAMISLLLAGLFPSLITHFVSLDIITIMNCSLKSLPEMTAMTVGSMLSFEKKQGQPPVYKDLEEVVNRRMLTTPDSLARDSAAIIMRRAIVDYQGGVVLRTDPRLKYTRTLNYSFEDQYEILKRYQGRLLVLRATGETHRDLKGLSYEKFVKLYEENCREFKLVMVQGTHTVHLDEPEKVLDHIVNFLETYTGMPLSVPNGIGEHAKL